MLVLGRTKDESIVIGDDITITVVSGGNGQQIRIGVNAPRHIPVYRKEIYDQIEEEKRREEPNKKPLTDTKKNDRQEVAI